MFKGRIEKLREAMNQKGLDGVLLLGDPNRNYLSGFTGNESYSLITKNQAFFITDSRFTQQAKQQVEDYEVLEYSKSGSFVDFLSDLVQETSIKRLGFEENIITYSIYKLYKSKVNCDFIPMHGIVEKIRIIKDDEELKLIKSAAEIADKAFAHMIDYIKPGMTEIQIGLELEFYMKKLGASDLSFPSIVASGVRSSLPHGEATNKVVNRGEFLTLDFGCIYREYCSDMTRTLVIGKPSDKMVEMYSIVLEAQKLALKEYKPGVPAMEVDAVARNYISNRGYGEYFGHSLGHGVGREIHESPVIGYRNKSKLVENMVVTDEPGIYIPDFGGLRIEDLLVVTKDGGKVLSKSPKEMICIG
ncbi:M24 family metallopeptidase [Clostridium tyrobutyricum]|uniref:Aminopeptidase YpdF (MP-, MA-, MS-, AP-, NP-specific) n=1 Tax=Clostridium tyrobutyricum DIVETGP TaxID=1408889 RepID=W6N2G9_CLOTY|nr:aminopeptidase P family protein [Clostridium tyrobutyricum]AND85217.1 aminopeptidase-like protein [Clostridium tyrobutyricum]ANP69774.1 Xaa-Pro dipeptidase [Clostridium tyrobutyricum]MBV4415220.1 aminopeptidase P family protein [Clostridium tyrobutyricum]MBV4420891.1 aminopeptidase P family protein [Clostridium tyrobutyricum]MBV4424000.1 aminopeptidase P family protein [Clostridium tyrobutyricum]